MPQITAGNRAIVRVEAGGALWVTATGNARYQIGLPILSASTSIPVGLPFCIGVVESAASVELICESGTLDYESQLVENLKISNLPELTVGAAGSASVLPANPAGYLRININGIERKIAYYNA